MSTKPRVNALIDHQRRTLLAAAGAALLLPAGAARAQAWPARPIRIIHGFDSGSNPDTVARIIAPALTERLGQSLVIEAKPGAGGRIATAYVATQEPDGYTLMMLTAGDSVTAATESKLPFDLLRDYAFISTVIQFPFVILVGADSPYKNLREFLDAAKRAPGKLNFGTPGIRTTQHFCGELLKSSAGVDLLHVPFKGSPFPDLIGGRLDCMIAAPSISTPQIKSGKVRALAVSGRTRLESLPEVATVAETVPGFEATTWFALFGPANLPREVVAKLNAEVKRVFALPDVQERLRTLGLEPWISSPDELAKFQAAEIVKWAKVVKDSGAKAE